MNLEQLPATLVSPIVIRPTRRMAQGELGSHLDTAANTLRGNADHAELRDYVFALLFYQRISDCFDEEVGTQAATLIAAGMLKVMNPPLSLEDRGHETVAAGDKFGLTAVGRCSF
jgi:type I restriction enzyme M protein